MSTWTLMSSVAIRWKRGRSSSGRTSWSAMTSNGNGKVSSRTRSARPSLDEVVDEGVHHGADDVVLPALHGLAGERLLDEASVGVVLRLVHLQDGVAEHRTHDLLVPLRREARRRLAATACTAVEGVDRPDRVLGRLVVGEAEHLPQVQLGDGGVPAQGDEVGVRVLDGAGPVGPVEEPRTGRSRRPPWRRRRWRSLSASPSGYLTWASVRRVVARIRPGSPTPRRGGPRPGPAGHERRRSADRTGRWPRSTP